MGELAAESQSVGVVVSGSNTVTYTTLVQVGSETINGDSARPVSTNPFHSGDSLSTSGTTTIVLQPVDPSCRLKRNSKTETYPKSGDTSSECSSYLIPGISPNSYERQLSAPPELDHQSSSAENLYEHLFIPKNSLLNTTVVRANSARSSSRKSNESQTQVSPLVSDSSDNPPPLIPRRNPCTSRLQR